jgi:hypothetical protein
VSTSASGFGTADIGLTVMGVVLLVACIVCCLAGIGFNSKRKKRERENDLAWDRVSSTIRTSSESNASGTSLSEPLNPANEGQDETFFESMWPTALFGAPPAALSSASPRPSATPSSFSIDDEGTTMSPLGYQSAPVVATPGSDNGSDYSEDGASMWPGALKKGKKEKEDADLYESMWPGTAPDTNSGKKEKVYGAAEEEEAAAAAVAEASWTMGDTAMIAEAQVEGADGAQGMAPVVAQEDDEEFHF